MTDFRALCSELIDYLDHFEATFNIPIGSHLVDRARATLAKPPEQKAAAAAETRLFPYRDRSAPEEEPREMTDQEYEDLVGWWNLY
jgi:hypothetical protein